MARTAIIIGVTGQDGGYLAQLLLSKGYRVIGGLRRSSTLNLPRLSELGIVGDLDLRTIDMQELPNMCRLIEDTGADEIYNLGGQSSVHVSFQQPIYTAESVGLGTLRLLEAIRITGGQARLFQASSSEIFGRTQTSRVNEATPMQPRSPYGVAKLFSHSLLVNYREAYDIHCASGILFNHESPMRSLEFVSRKITTTLAQIACGGQGVLRLGNLDTSRDWSYAGDVVRAMWQMMQVDQADDFVIASGKLHSVRDWVERVCAFHNFDLEWDGAGDKECAFDKKTGRKLVVVDPAFYRPLEPMALSGDSQKAYKDLNWTPEVDFDALVEMMAKRDYDRACDDGNWF